MFKLLIAENPEPVLVKMQEIGVLEAIEFSANLTALPALIRVESQPDAIRRLACILRGKNTVER